MYIIQATSEGKVLYFGPFKSTARAKEYATSIDKRYGIEILPIISPFNP